MAPVIGIDLGTTNTVVAVVQNGQAAALSDEAGQVLIPSVVSFHPNGTVLVGRSAKERRLVDASNTIYSIKRLIGRSWDSEEVHTARKRFPFAMREGPGQACLVGARGETYTLPEISAFVLRKAKAVAEAALGVSIERAVITVPANFNDLQRAATKVAGRVAGLDVLRILNEPTAAALAYGFGKASSERLAVYDFGGGTFDVTLLDLSDNVFEVLATAGNTFLGGDDIDLIIAERMADDFLARHRYDPRSNPTAFERLRSAAELLKQRLSFEEQASVSVEDLAHGPGGKALGLEFGMTRAELETWVAPIVDRTFDVCREALTIARRNVRDFDEVLLVGGSTRMPLVRHRVEEFFQREVKAQISPDEVVAIGAAIQANALTGAERRRGTVPAPPAALRRSQPSLGTVVMPTIHVQPAASPSPRPRVDTLSNVSAPKAGSAAERPGTRTSVGLGPSIPSRAEAPPVAAPARPGASEEARQARDSVSDLLPILAADTPPQEESAAFALGDGDIEYVYVEDEITTRGGNLPSAGDDEPTQSGKGPSPNAVFERQTLPELERASSPVGYPPPPPAPPSSRVPFADSAPPASFGNMDFGLPPLEQPVALPRRPESAAPHSNPSPGIITGVMPSMRAPAPPLLVDVTPLTLTVETIRGFCDEIIARNTPVPCEQTREFVTAADGQTVVRVRVAQGESRLFRDNTLLGEVELSGLPAKPRGNVQIAVTFALDANGMLSVSAVESSTGRATAAQLRLVGLPESHEIAAMAHRQNVRQSV